MTDVNEDERWKLKKGVEREEFAVQRCVDINLSGDNASRRVREFQGAFARLKDAKCKSLFRAFDFGTLHIGKL